MKKIKTIEAVDAYRTLKALKTSSMSDDAAMRVWKNMKALRQVADTYDKDVKEAQESLKDDKFEEMQGKLKTAQENERKMKEEGYTYTKEDTDLLQEVNAYFAAFGKKTMEYFNELADKEVEVEITEVEEAELLKAIKACEKSFDDMEMLACICK